ALAVRLRTFSASGKLPTGNKLSRLTAQKSFHTRNSPSVCLQDFSFSTSGKVSETLDEFSRSHVIQG
ncbi:hypothetical protein, partial [Salmonella enterica]|uniref:hypothetical protein n=1 Tax=Salmonella enterica TaxID=28901 RepID=UPI001F40119B